jgi:hypothetical protein
LVTQAIAVAIVLPLGCILILIPMWLVLKLEFSIWWLAIPAALYALILVGGGIGFLFFSIYRRSRHLDEAAAPLGLTGSGYQLFYRQYQGRLSGRDVGVYFYRGPTVEIDIPTDLQTRMGIAQRQSGTMSLAGMLGQEPLTLSDPELSDLAVFSIDETWARLLLDQSGTPGLLQRLITFEAAYTYRQVILQPGLLRLRLFGSRNLLDFRFDITPDRLSALVDDLLALVQIAESLPEPQVKAEETSAERAARSLRAGNPNLMVAITIGMVLAMVLCFGAIGVIAFIWAMAQ